MRFWDLSTKERAALKEEDLRAMINVELMEKGVLRVEAPKMEEIAEVELHTRTMFTVECEEKSDRYNKETFPVCWPTEEEAVRFLSSGALVLKRDWRLGNEYQHVAPSTLKVVAIQVYDYAELVNAKSALDENEAKKKRNKEAMDAFAAASKRVEETTRDLWSVYYGAVATAEEMKSLTRTWNDYMEMTGKQPDIAARFLMKAVGRDKLAEFFEWQNITQVPLPEESDA